MGYYVSILLLSFVRNANMSLLPQMKNNQIPIKISYYRTICEIVTWYGLKWVPKIYRVFLYLFLDTVWQAYICTNPWKNNAHFTLTIYYMVSISPIYSNWTQNTNKIQLHFMTTLMKRALLLNGFIYACIS